MPFDADDQSAAAEPNGSTEEPSTRSNFDPAVADQLTTMLISTARSNFDLNSMMSRNHLANAGAALTLGVQQNNMASLRQITKLEALEAAAAANIISSQQPTYFAALNTGAGVPVRGGNVNPPNR